MPRSTLEALVDRYCAAVLSQEQSNIIGISGGPNSGKSSLVKLFSRRGIETIEEVATRLINQHGHAIRADVTAFQIAIIEEQLRVEIPLRESGRIAVGDRAVFDSAGYFKLRGLAIPDHVAEQFHRISSLSHRPLYRVVFMLDTIEKWDDDGIRNEDVEFSRRLLDEMVSTYTAFGEQVVRVPIFSSARAQSNRQRVQMVVRETAKRGLFLQTDANAS